jgi:hypothetical protein
MARRLLFYRVEAPITGIPTEENLIMTGKKLLALLIAPLFAVGMAACGTDQTDDDIWTEEGQLPAYEDPTYQDPMLEPYQDTVVVPDAHPERPEDDLTTQPQPETETTY